MQELLGNSSWMQEGLVLLTTAIVSSALTYVAKSKVATKAKNLLNSFPRPLVAIAYQALDREIAKNIKDPRARSMMDLAIGALKEANIDQPDDVLRTAARDLIDGFNMEAFLQNAKSIQTVTNSATAVESRLLAHLGIPEETGDETQH